MRKYLVIMLVTIALAWGLAADAICEPPAGAPPAAPKLRAYGEWRIHVRPDKGQEYARLIETKGLPLFRAAGGRMVGWWTTLVGDLYEHVTIWEYDDMAAFEQAVHKLGSDKQFAEFVRLRDPLLVGEENRFLHLTAIAAPPSLPENSPYVIHELHRVPLARKAEYLKFMQTEGLGLLKRNGFRPVGPWITGVGNWCEITYLFRFDSLSEREELIAAFAAKPDATNYETRLNALANEVSTRILMPAPFAHPTKSPQP